MKTIVFFQLCLWLSLIAKSNQAEGQGDSTSHYLTASFGFNYNNYHSLGARIYFDYSKEFLKNWQWSISYEQTHHVGEFAAPEESESLHVSHSILSGNIYRKVPLWKDKIFWRLGVGAGLIHAFWDRSNRFGPSVNISAGLHIKVFPNVWITTSAIPFLFPTNRFTYAPLRITGFNDFKSGSVFNFGFQFRVL
ncbi:MAG TPA: hypothetical protein VJ911_03370 [Cryomorphaceae bacterium]|nr:hypothetical protein [Cryomorphaceae bacterium]